MGPLLRAALATLALCLAAPGHGLSAGEVAEGTSLLKGWRTQERPPNRPAEGQTRTLLVAATSDLHGWIVRDTLYPKVRPGGLAHLAPVIARLRREHPGMILLDGGDTMQGAPNLTYLARQGSAAPPPVLELMNLLAYDAVTLGNHDLEQGREALARWVGQAAFPWLAANVTRGGGRLVLPPYRIIERGNLRVGVLGLITPGAPIWVDGRHLGGLKFGNMREAARRWVPILRDVERADVVIGLFHSGLSGWYDRSVAMRHSLPLPNAAGQIADESGFDLIVSGHAHRLAPRRARGGDSAYAVPVVQPGARGEALAVARLHLRGSGGRWRVTAMTREALRADLKPDPAMVSRVAPVLRGTRAWLAQPTLVRFTNLPERGALHACAGGLSHDAAVGLAAAVSSDNGAGNDAGPDSGRADFSLLPMLWRFDPREAERPGASLTRAHLHRWMRYENTLVLARLTGRQMALLLDPYARRKGGLRVRLSAVLFPGGVTPRIAPGGSVVLALVPVAGGDALPPHAPQSVWLSNYHWNGGGGLARRALLHPSQFAGQTQATLRELVFRLLSDPAYRLPAPCRAFLAKG